MSKAIERQIAKIYKDVFNKVFTKKALQELEDGNPDEYIVNITKLVSSRLYKKFCKEFAIKLAKKGLNNERGLWKKYFQAAKTAGLIAITSKYSDYEKSIFERAIKHNFKMIKSMPEEIMKTFKEKGVQLLLQQVVEGSAGRRSFEKALREHGVKKAGVIARTETSKLTSVITEYRARNLSSVAYFWRASRDKRTRPSHREMEGVIVFFRKAEQKPLRDNMRGNAGEFPNCRCFIEPIFGEHQLRKNSYKVYDYRTDKIEVMPKKMVINYLNNGSLD